MSVNQQKWKLNPVNILLRIPVPWVFVLTYLAGLIFQFILPFNLYSEELLIYARISGIVLFILGVLFASWSLIIFHRARTTTTPGESSKKIVMYGPYRYTRNPMYVSLILAYLGGGRNSCTIMAGSCSSARDGLCQLGGHSFGRGGTKKGL